MNGLVCSKERRREKIRQHQKLNGLDYLEVGSIHEGSQQTHLTVHLLGKAPVTLTRDNILIEGGQRISDIKVKNIEVISPETSDFDDLIKIEVDKAGDFSDYTLKVVEKNQTGGLQKHSQFDPRYDSISFNFKVDCPNDLDCAQETICPTDLVEEPDLNYLAKDYASFRQLILDRLSLLIPEWQERHVPDIGIALTEILAYTGDHLSYYQDAVATEAYIDTARQRVSVRRHARLVDYSMHEGCNARTWVCAQIDQDEFVFPSNEKLKFITGLNNADNFKNTIISTEALQKIPQSQYEVFEPLSNDEIKIYQDHNQINFYTWGNQECCIPKGSTSAVLVGAWIPRGDVGESDCNPENVPNDDKENSEDSKSSDKHQRVSTVADSEFSKEKIKLRLEVGDVLIFEEIIGPQTGHPQDANPKHRHPVKITEISGSVDPLNGQALTHISWDAADALPFPLCISAMSSAPECKLLENISVACGNVILVDHGCSVDQELPKIPNGQIIECCKKEGMATVSEVIPSNYYPALEYAPLTFCEPLLEDMPATQMLVQNERNAIAKVQLNNFTTVNNVPVAQIWKNQKDLLSSKSNDFHFVAEVDNDGRAHCRFGNNELGRSPEPDSSFMANYRIGGGTAGNVGANTIAHINFSNSTIEGVNLTLRNPLPAQGGKNAESITDVKLFAPHAFRKELQRAIIAEDYAEIVMREFSSKVQKAYAKLHWTGSWYEVLVAIDQFGQEQANQELLDEITACLYRYRRMGHDLIVKSAQRVALDIEIKVCVLPNYLRGHVKAELLKVFSNQRLVNGNLGLFHPDELTFGDDIYLSKLVAAAQCVEGVASVEICKFQRWCEVSNNEIENGVLPLSSFEIARLDNDPNYIENGIINFDMRGGR